MKRIVSTCLLTAGLLTSGLAQAQEKSILMLVQSGHGGESNVRAFGDWIESVRPNYAIDFSADLSPDVLDSATSLTAEQMALLESYDLIIMPRYGVGGSSGMASTDWNDVTTPLILMNPFMRTDGTRWGWVPSGTGGSSSPGIMELVVTATGSPYFDGIDTSTGLVEMHLSPLEQMQVETAASNLNGTSIGWTDRRENDDWTPPENDPDATPPELGNLREYPWVHVWDGTEASFFPGGTEAPGGHRTLFLGLLNSNMLEYTLEGRQLFLNAISIAMTGQSDPGNVEVPVEEPVPPVENAKVLFLTDVGAENDAIHIAYTDLLTSYFPGMTVTRSGAYADADPLSATQMEELAAYDLIVLPRVITRAAYGSLSWNDVQAPILNFHPRIWADWRMFYRDSGGARWQFHMEAVGSETDHEIFRGVSRLQEMPEGVNDPDGKLDTFSPIGHYQMYTDVIDTDRLNTTQGRTYGNFLGGTAGDTRRSMLTVWRGGEPYGYSNRYNENPDDTTTETLLPTPVQARGAFLVPGEDGDPAFLAEAGKQLLFNTANWLIRQKGIRPHAHETFNQYDFDGTSVVVSSLPAPQPWESITWSGVAKFNVGSSTGGVTPNTATLSIQNDGYDATDVWRPLTNGPRSTDDAFLVDWSFKVRFNDATLDDVNAAIAIGKDTAGSGADNMRQGNAAAIGINQTGGANEIHYIDSNGATTAISGVQADAWYQVSVKLDLVEQVYSVAIDNLDDSDDPAQSFSAENVPFIGSVDALDYVAIFTPESFGLKLDVSLDDILVTSAQPPADATPFELWQAENSVSGADGDPDGDGISNLMEYLLGGDPNLANTAIRPESETVQVSGDTYLQIKFARDVNATGVQAVVERSDDLLTWTELSGPAESVSENGFVWETWRDSQPAGAASRSFLRLKTEQTD